MHIPDGFMNAGVSVGAGITAAGGISAAVRRTSQALEEEQIPLAGLVAAFVFAAQMVNVPIAAGTSGHLMGGALAAILVGPWVGVLCMTVVVMVQAFFADGGLTALGLNLVNMALIGPLGGYLVLSTICRLRPHSKRTVVLAAGFAGFIAVVLGASAFTFQYALGGAGEVATSTVATAMIGIHAVIGLGEGIVTALVVGFVLGVRPDLVHGARDLPTEHPLPARPQVSEGVR